MLHELFLALSGHGNALFNTLENFEPDESIKPQIKSEIITKESQNASEIYNSEEGHYDKVGLSSFKPTVGKIIGSSSLFHPCENKIISEILQVAGHYQKIRQFYEKILSHSISVSDAVNQNSLGKGHYLTTFATSLYEETKAYQKKVIELESEYLENPHLLLSSILLNVTPSYHIFVGLGHLIDEVEKEKLHGCKILNYLHREVILSVGEIQEVYARIKHSLQKVLIEQLTYWLLYGELLDSHKELFLKITQRTTTGKPDENHTQADTNSLSLEVSLEVDMLPEFIPLATAEKILFIGESILCFEREGAREKGDFGSRSGLILKKRERELLERFEALSLHHSFAMKEFLDLIETVRLCVAQHLYTLVTGAGLISELEHIKDIFLLGRGELYQAFFILSENKRPNATNVNALFQRAGRQVMMEESVLDKFVVTYEEPESAEEKTSLWRHLRIEYMVEWPLHRFFDERVQAKYNAILRFLLDIRLSQLRLQYLWLLQKDNKAIKNATLGLRFWTLRHRMSLLIYNIQYYIQVDVFESRFSELKEEMSQLRDYQRLSFRHQSFLSSIAAQCFLSHPLISSSISHLLEKVNAFCALFEAAPTPHLQSQMEDLEEDFDRASAKFFWALTTLGQRRNCQHTSQLIMRIDYNKFYTRKTSRLKFLENV